MEWNNGIISLVAHARRMVYWFEITQHIGALRVQTAAWYNNSITSTRGQFLRLAHVDLNATTVVSWTLLHILHSPPETLEIDRLWILKEFNRLPVYAVSIIVVDRSYYGVELEEDSIYDASMLHCSTILLALLTRGAQPCSSLCWLYPAAGHARHPRHVNPCRLPQKVRLDPIIDKWGTQ